MAAPVSSATSFCSAGTATLQGNKHDMDPPGRLEIYIPAEAEVKSIPLWSLPDSVLRRMGLPPSDSEGSTRLAGSPEGIWICPVTLRRKGQKGTDNMSSVLGTEFNAASGPLRMSFSVFNLTAYQLLKDIPPGRGVSAHRSHTDLLLPQGLAPPIYQTAVVIYRGNIYLSIRKPSRSQRKRETRDPQPTAQSSNPSTSSSKSQRKELLNDNRPKRKNTRKVTRSKSKSRTARAVPQSAGREHKVDGLCDRDGGGEQDLDGEDAESTGRNSDVDTNQIDGGEVDGTEPLAAAQASSSQMKEFDFEQLAQDERIALMKTKLRQKEPALGNFPSL